MKRRTFLKAAAMTAAASPFTGSASRGNLLAQESRAGVRSVLLITKCHLDVGFSGTEANIRQLYFQKHFPNAMRTAAQLRAAGADRYIWTTGSWLLYEYLEQASPAERRQIEAAVTAGDLSWHALPFSWQTEMLDRSMIDGGLSFSAELDRRFGTKTIAAKMTDVPGHTRGLIAPLASAGVQMLNIGVNAASTPPDVPELFVWKSPAGSSVMVMYHLHDYGGVVRIPGTGVAVAVDMRGDNEGPHTPAQIAEIYANLRGQFPGADVHAATLNDAAAAIAPIRNTLPVVTAEIGDTWIYGVASDPPKVANFRAAMRLRQQWIDDRQWALGDANDRLLLRRLLLGAEHTWGTDTKSHLDNDHYLPADLREVLGRPEYRLMQTSWQEKRDDVAQAFDDLPEQQRSAVRGAMDLPSATAPSTAGMRPHADLSHLPPLSFRHFDVGVDPATGAITRLRDRLSGRELASADHPLAVITYQTLSAETYAAFLDRYLKIHEDWAPRDFGKPGIEHFGAMDGSWHPRVVRLWTASSAAEDRLLMELAPSDHDAANKGRAWPRQIFVDLRCPTAQPEVRLQVTLLQKPENRMPEALWLSFQPQLPPARLVLSKSGEMVDAEDVIRGGGRAMHAVTGPVQWRSARKSMLSIDSTDTALVAVGERSPLNFSLQPPALQHGVHFGLFNNAWGTNYPQWCGGDWSYRFRLQV